MAKRFLPGLVLILLISSIFLPFYTIYISTAIPSDLAGAFPSHISGFQLLVNADTALPTAQMPALEAFSFNGATLLLGLCLCAASVLMAMLSKKYLARVAPLFSLLGAFVLFEYALYARQLSSGLLTGVMLSAQWTVWIPPLGALVLVVLQGLQARAMAHLGIGENTWRIVSAVLLIITALLVFLPFTHTYVPDGLFADAYEDNAMGITQTGIDLITKDEPLISAYSTDGHFVSPTTSGNMAQLVSISGNAKTIANMFKISSYRPTDHSMLALGLILLFITGLITLFKGIDKWIPACLSVVGTILTVVACVSVLILPGDAQFAGVTLQMFALGLGSFTVMPMVISVLAITASLAGALRIASANNPYFHNPVPKNKQLRTVAVALAAVAIALMLMPSYSVGIYAPGKSNQAPASQTDMSGLSLIINQRSDTLTNPLDRKGASYYTDEAPASNGYTQSDVRAIVNRQLALYGILTLAAILLLLAYIVTIVSKRFSKRVSIVLACLGTVTMLASILLATYALPKDLGSIAPIGTQYFALVAAAFAAFFAGFTDKAELPKKYKLFLMLLPFLGFSVVFAYLPLTGWRYAFYDYKLGLPMDQQVFVGFKWFTQMFTNPAQRNEVLRVLQNTFAMSGIGLLTSWMPVLFAILLTEIKTGWFKKLAQIFTTLPNFISWVLVFSFALTIFSLDTGVVNRVLLDLGILSEPVAWLNSSSGIWVKMWLWGTWKGLGWGSIMYLAAIAGIDQELYEAARVDGAGRFRQIWHITVPGILPTFFVLLLLSISNVINNGMEQYLVFQNAMNKSTIEVLDLYVYNISLGSKSSTTISMATAIGILKSIVSVVLLFLANNFSKAVRGESIV